MASYDALKAMTFARSAHADQRRKYTGNPYADHLAEVAGIVATVAAFGSMSLMVSVAWLHDCVEDQGVSLSTLKAEFGPEVAIGVAGLSDLETGNRAERKAASRARLAACDGWIQTIKVADLISNTSSIVMHDPKFATVYLAEKRLLLDVLTQADHRLVAIARAQIGSVCLHHPDQPAVTELDGDGLCLACANDWVCGEGDYQRYIESEGGDA